MAETSRNEKKNARRQAREQVFGLLYETEFHEGETAEQILERAAEDREFDGNDPYLRGTYLGVMAHLEEIDALIGRFAKGWKTKRLSRVSRAVLRLGTYELRQSTRQSNCPKSLTIRARVPLSTGCSTRSRMPRLTRLLRRSRLSSHLRCRRPMCRTRNKIHAVSGYAYLLGRY